MLKIQISWNKILWCVRYIFDNLIFPGPETPGLPELPEGPETPEVPEFPEGPELPEGTN